MRTEHDFLGDKPIPDDAYWGVHSARAVENFPISGNAVSQMPELIRALAFVKKAAAQANAELGVIDRPRAGAIIKACDDLIRGELHAQFVVDVIQGGAGTSTNMNANEVIANRALEHMGHEKGRYDALHPNDHVNASQSTNDVYPTALRVAAWFGIDELLGAMALLRGAFEAKAEEFKAVLKIGRTQLQDAVPMTLGQEFLAFAIMIGEDEARLREARTLITEVNLGATAIGTGINAPARLCRDGGADARAGQRRAGGARPPTWSKPHRTPVASCSSPACSSAWPASSARSATTCACSPAARRPASATSSCRRVRPARRSCRAR